MPKSNPEEFELDKETQKIIDEALKHIEKYHNLPFEERAKILTEYLQKRGIQVERDKTFGDVIYTTPEGWGIIILFNDEARRRKGDIVW